MSKSIVLKNRLVSYIYKENNHILFFLSVLWGIWNIIIFIFYILVLALYILKIYMPESNVLKHGLVCYINKENNHILFLSSLLWSIWNITIVIFYILVLALYLLKIYMS